MPAISVRQSFKPTAALEQLAHACPDAVIVVIDQRIAYANPAACALLGAPRFDDLGGRRFMEFSPSDSLGSWERLLCDGVAAEEEPLNSVIPLTRLDGEEIPCILSVAGSRLGARRAVQILARPLSRTETGADRR